MPFVDPKKRQAAAKRKYDEAPSLNRCRRCNEPPVEGRKFCQYHLDYARLVNSAVPDEVKRARSKATTDRAKEGAFETYGRECACCGESTKEFLTFDHIDGGGAEHRRLTGSGGMSAKLRAAGYPPGFRTLCFNCNAALGIYSVCPHGTLGVQETNHPTNRKARGLEAFDVDRKVHEYDGSPTHITRKKQAGFYVTLDGFRAIELRGEKMRPCGCQPCRQGSTNHAPSPVGRWYVTHYPSGDIETGVPERGFSTRKAAAAWLEELLGELPTRVGTPP